MRFLSLLLIVSFLTGACSVKPEPFKFGKDLCHTCKMTLMDPKFGAEVVTKKGRIFKFDDLVCLNQYLQTEKEAEQNLSHLLVIDFEKGDAFTDAREAWYVFSTEIKSPMAGHTAAFSSRETAEKFSGTVNGTLQRWDEVSGKK